MRNLRLKSLTLHNWVRKQYFRGIPRQLPINLIKEQRKGPKQRQLQHIHVQAGRWNQNRKETLQRRLACSLSGVWDTITTARTIKRLIGPSYTQSKRLERQKGQHKTWTLQKCHPPIFGSSSLTLPPLTLSTDNKRWW